MIGYHMKKEGGLLKKNKNQQKIQKVLLEFVSYIALYSDHFEAELLKMNKVDRYTL